MTGVCAMLSSADPVPAQSDALGNPARILRQDKRNRQVHIAKDTAAVEEINKAPSAFGCLKPTGQRKNLAGLPPVGL